MLALLGFRLARRLIFTILTGLVLLPNTGLSQSAKPEPRHASTIEETKVATPNGTQPRPRKASDESLILPEQSAFERLFASDPRVRARAGEHDLVRFALHGQYQVRYGSVPDVPLNTYGLGNYRNSLGQTHRLEHLLRFSPRFTYRNHFAIISQFDLPKGMLLGQRTNHVNRDAEPLDEAQPMRGSLRELYLDFRFSRGSLLVGQQAANFGLGLVDDSGDNRQFMGDPRLGTLVDRVAYRGRPLGAKSPWELLVATDYVFSNGHVSATTGDHALRAVMANRFIPSPHQNLGMQVIAERIQPHFDDPTLKRLAPTESSVTFDLTGQTLYPVAGTSASLVLEGEFAYVTGTTDLAAEVLAPRDARIRRSGAIARAGVVRQHASARPTSASQGILFEFGYASGDANPGDGVDRRFTMNPGRRVGLILFDEVLRWKSARAAVALEDRRLGARTSGLGFELPSSGAVPSATYLASQWLYRPIATFDLRLSALIAQTTADFVDPVQLVTRGVHRNYDGGLATHRDLGAELDVATEYRAPLDHGLCATIGAEAGILFPGRALSNASGTRMDNQGLVRGRFGFYF